MADDQFDRGANVARRILLSLQPPPLGTGFTQSILCPVTEMVSYAPRSFWMLIHSFYPPLPLPKVVSSDLMARS